MLMFGEEEEEKNKTKKKKKGSTVCKIVNKNLAWERGRGRQRQQTKNRKKIVEPGTH